VIVGWITKVDSYQITGIFLSTTLSTSKLSFGLSSFLSSGLIGIHFLRVKLLVHKKIKQELDSEAVFAMTDKWCY
jgi:hypothetical protein